MERSCYKIITYRGVKDELSDIIWQIKAPHKVHAFLWLIAKKFHFDMGQFTTWMEGIGICMLCQKGEENIKHMLLVPCNIC